MSSCSGKLQMYIYNFCSLWSSLFDMNYSMPVCVWYTECVDTVLLSDLADSWLYVCVSVCVLNAVNLRKELYWFYLLFHFTGHSPLMAVMENETGSHPSYIPHYLLHGDPFASRLSREADIVAAFYICIIGQSLIAKTAFLSFYFYLAIIGIEGYCNQAQIRRLKHYNPLF